MTSTFERYADRLEAQRLVEAGVIGPGELTGAIAALDEAIAGIEGHGFSATPFGPQPRLAAAVGFDSTAELWVKDETGNVSGSHKARHLFGVALAYRLDALARVRERPAGSPGLQRPGAKSQQRYAIASCGNAALAAAVVARAVDVPLDVFVPDWANEAVVARIEQLGGRVVRCERRPGVAGDPAHHAFLQAISAGAVPFSCQGTETPATIDGGRTLAYEMVDALAAAKGAEPAASGRSLPVGAGAISTDRGQARAGAGSAPARVDRIFVQVGGGALASSVVTGLAACARWGLLAALPVVHAVQPLGNHPMVRAWDRLISELLGQPVPVGNTARVEAAQSLGQIDGSERRAVMARLRRSPNRYMTPWEKPPTSYATGILDDVTHDWLPVAEAMLASGGCPLVASEADLRGAHSLAHALTGIDVCPTGASGLGGLLALQRCGTTPLPGERVALLFTGRMRPGDPLPVA